MAKGNHSFTEQEIRKRFGAIIGHTVAEVDTAGVLTASAASRNKGRIGAVIEQSVLGYPADSDRRPDKKLPNWRYLKGAKREERTNKKTGFTYTYSEGAMSFPDSIEKPSRTILTGEGGTGASRFKHVIECPDGRFRRLVPDELDQLQGFPKGWTDTGMTDGHRAFCMGNALVTGVPHRIGEAMVEFYGL